MANSYIDSIKHAIGFLLGQPKSEGDAIELLKADHKRVKELVAEFKEAEDQEKRAICTKIIIELTVHAKLEEELVYPLMREEGAEENSQVDEATIEHDCVKYLIRELAGQGPTDDKFNAKVIVLGELVEHHVKEEEGEMFPQLRVSGNDMIELGEKLAKRKEELLQEIEERPYLAHDDEGRSAKKSGHRTANTRERKSGRTKPGKRDAKAAPKKGSTKSGGTSSKSKRSTSGKAAKPKAKSATNKTKAAKSKTTSTSKSTSKTTTKGSKSKTRTNKSTANKVKASSSKSTANKAKAASSKSTANKANKAKPATSKSTASKRKTGSKSAASKTAGKSATKRGAAASTKSSSANKAQVDKKKSK